MDHLSLQDRVSTNVRILLDRRGRSHGYLAALLGMDYTDVTNRLDGIVRWDTVDIERAAEVLGVPWQLLVKHNEVEVVRRAAQPDK